MPSVAIKVSPALAEVAPAAAADADRSLTGQIEHWARLDKAIEPLFNTPTIAALKKSGGDLSALEDEQEKARVLEALERFRLTSRELVRDQLGLAQKTLIQPDPDHPGHYIRTNPDGTREHGVLEGHQFIPA